MSRRTFIHASGIALCFLLAACLGLYPLLLDPARNVGATLPTDYYHFNWNYWWMRHALTHGLPLYTTNYVLAPAMTSLAYHTLTPFWFPVWAVFEPLFGGGLHGTLAAMNALYVLATALTGGLCYGLLRHEGAPRAWSLAGGFAFMYTPALTLAAFIGDINYVSQFWLPGLLLAWGWVASATRPPSAEPRLWRVLVRGAIFGVALYGAAMTDYQHLLFAAFLLVPYGVWSLVRAGRRARAGLIAAGVLGLAVFVLLMGGGGTLAALLAFDRATLAPQPIANARGIAFPLGYLWHSDAYATRQISLGLGVLLAAGGALLAGGLQRARDRRWLWLIALVLPLVFSLGVSVDIGGAQVATPYVLLHQAFGGLFRSPARFAPVIVLAALVAGGIALRQWRAPRSLVLARKPGFAVALILFALADARAFQPMPVRPAAPRYAFYEAIGREQGAGYDDLIVLDIPVAGGSGEAWVGGGTNEFLPMETQLYAVVHGRRVLNGSLARAPLSSFWYWLTDDPMLAWLGQRRYLEPATVTAQLRQRIADWPLGYLIVHQDLIGREQPANVEILGFLNMHPELVCPLAVELAEGRDAPAVAYRTIAHPMGCPVLSGERGAPSWNGDRPLTLDLGALGDEVSLGWGWYPAEVVGGVTWRWAGAPHPDADRLEARLYFDLPAGVSAVTLRAQAFGEARAVTVFANGQPIGQAALLPDALADYAFPLPAAVTAADGRLELVLAYDGAGDAGGRRLAVAVDQVRFTAGE